MPKETYDTTPPYPAHWPEDMKTGGGGTNQARFRARFIAALAPFAAEVVPFTNPSYDFRGLQIEPDPRGGVHLMATNGATMAWIYDKKGSADAPMVVDLPLPLVKACTEIPHPQLFDVNSVECEYDLPGWLRPGGVLILSNVARDVAAELEGRRPAKRDFVHVHVCVMADGKLPDEQKASFGEDGAGFYTGLADEEVVMRPLVHWRYVIEKLAQEPTGVLRAQPVFLADVDAFAEHYRKSRTEEKAIAEIRLHGEKQAIVFAFPEDDEKAGLVVVMPTKMPEPGEADRYTAWPAQAGEDSSHVG